MTLKLTVSGNELFDFIKLDAGVDDAAVNLLLESAKDEAETFVNTNFPDSYNEPTEVPKPVKAWVFNRVAQLYENRGVGAPPDYTLLKPYRFYSFKG
jgi:Leucine-rich repeat (LRR) protein